MTRICGFVIINAKMTPSCLPLHRLLLEQIICHPKMKTTSGLDTSTISSHLRQHFAICDHTTNLLCRQLLHRISRSAHPITCHTSCDQSAIYIHHPESQEPSDDEEEPHCLTFTAAKESRTHCPGVVRPTTTCLIKQTNTLGSLCLYRSVTQRAGHVHYTSAR